MGKILIVNPNSSAAVTASMQSGVAAMKQGVPHTLEWMTNVRGPLGIETDAHVQAVGAHLEDIVAASDADAFVVGCFSDPAVAVLRQQSGKPVVGIAEAAYRYAMTLSSRFGIISIVDASVVRHKAHLEALGIHGFLAGDRPLQLGVEALEGEGVLARLIEIGTALRDVDGADVLILGCAGLGRYRVALQNALGVPVIDPVMASVAHLNSALLMQMGPV